MSQPKVLNSSENTDIAYQLRLNSILDVQYQCTEDYCNSKTALWNSLQSNRDVLNATVNCENALRRLQETHRDLQALKGINDHMVRTERIIKTIQGPVTHANGVMREDYGELQFHQALSSLRASIRTFRGM
jgi:hypothetical protein